MEGQYPTGQVPLAEVLRAFIAPALTLSADAANGGSPFVKVLARAYVEYREELRAFLSEHYGAPVMLLRRSSAASTRPVKIA